MEWPPKSLENIKNKEKLILTIVTVCGMRVCGMRMRAFCSIATEVFGYGPRSSRITFGREYARILTHKIFKSAAYRNYDFNSKHGFEVFIWAVQVAVRLVNARQTL
jgi:hypothetical protein